MPSSVAAFAAAAADTPLAPLAIERREVGPQDVAIDILWCGVCHSDLHYARNEWGRTVYPAVPGHEIVGRVREVGSGVKRHKPGDLVGVGCMVDSCRTCEPCTEGEEQFCAHQIGTYGGVEKGTQRQTFGGYSRSVVVDEHFVLRIPAGLDPAKAAPLLCAGITTYSPLRHWGVGPGKKVGVVGLGGLGHMGVKLAHAMGAEVVVFTTSPSKFEEARKLGADSAILSTDPAQMKAHNNSFHFILNTVSAAHNLDHYVRLLRRNGTMCLVGAPAEPHKGPGAWLLLGGRRSVAGSPIGGIRETQEMLDFCAEHDVTPETEVIAMGDINAAYERMLRNDVRYRFVIDMSTLG
ncbi:MAG: NAD(P)-dependent alcohol dehydrogenase [Alphaproteobacteria bacterium]|nr:NAD(P)-dependent alcohol dehydrogenase [Alphaproteobacteria bacterium]